MTGVRSDDLFSYAQAQNLRDRGMQLAVDAQDQGNFGWSERAYAAIERVAREHTTVHVDDVLQRFTEQPDRPNAWGAVWQRAIRNKVIRHSGRVRPCKVDRRKHAHQYPEYVSLFFLSQETAGCGLEPCTPPPPMSAGRVKTAAAGKI